MIGFGQLVIIFIIVLIFFGAGKVPKIMRELGLGMKAFKKGLEEDYIEESDNNKKKNTTISINTKKVKQKSSKKNVKKKKQK